MQDNESYNGQYGVPNQPPQNTQYGVPSQAPQSTRFAPTQAGQPGGYTPPIVRDTLHDSTTSSKAVPSLIMGILGLIGCWIPIWNLIFSIGGMILGIICISKHQRNRGIGIAGLVISIIALLISIIYYMLLLVGLAAMGM